jgi:hypothetical protein
LQEAIQVAQDSGRVALLAVISWEKQTQTLPEITALEEEGKSAAVVFTVLFTPANEGR